MSRQTTSTTERRLAVTGAVALRSGLLGRELRLLGRWTG
ncbi:hypothetical protein IW245_003881 [Longispora fulva]|uniref:Uncharacterized protein n=1 Tax=Longispora fulva TaxID=619741 RepID=A0A8J7KXD7_9ACTN|nr:hypothetical protein [Longispora fulva]